jgi:hypothetical protein
MRLMFCCRPEWRGEALAKKTMMKLSISSAAKALVLALGAVLLTQASASAGTLLSQGINLGHAGPDLHNWAIFSLGGDSQANDFSNNSQVFGDVGLAGSAKLNMSGGSKVWGTVYKRTTGTVNLSNGASITGGIVQNAATDSMLAQGVTDAISASNAAFGLSVSAGYPTTVNANSSLTLSGSGNVVLKLTDFVVSSGATLTLQGNASTSFVINVNNNFNVTNGATVKLAGGLTWDHVLFNVRGTGSTVTLTGGSQLMSGILLATDRTVKLDNGVEFKGEIIANKVTLAGGAKVTRLPVVSP